MPSKTEKIENLEKQLQNLNNIKNESTSLSSIYASINGRIKALSDIKSEVEDITKDLYYYDMVDYLKNVACDTLQLSQCGCIIKDLANAKLRFEADGDIKYLTECIKIQKKIREISMKRCEQIFETERFSYENIYTFYCAADDELKIKIQNFYFSSRKKSIKNKISECIKDLRKNYQLFLLGEIKNFERIFKIDYFKEYKTIETFRTYLISIFKLVFREIHISKTKKIILDIKVENLNGENAIMRDLLVSLASEAYGFVDSSFSENAAIEL